MASSSLTRAERRVFGVEDLGRKRAKADLCRATLPVSAMPIIVRPCKAAAADDAMRLV